MPFNSLDEKVENFSIDGSNLAYERVPEYIRRGVIEEEMYVS